MSIFQKKDEFSNPINKQDTTTNECEAMPSNTLVVELLLPNKTETEIRTFTGYDFVIDEDNDILYICADEDYEKGIVAFNLQFVVSYRIENDYMNV